MQKFLSRTSKLDSVLLIFISVLLLSFHFYLINFVNSTYLNAFVGKGTLSLLYGFGALINLGVFASAPKLLRKVGMVRLTLILTFIEALSLILLAFPIYPAIALSAFIMHMSVATVLLYCLDMLLEQFDTAKNTGSLRGMYLTVWNLPPIITPLIAGLILDSNTINIAHAGSKAVSLLHLAGFWKIYIISAIFLIPFVIIIRANFMNLKDPHYPKIEFKSSIAKFYQHRNIFDVFADRFLLNLYYAWNTIYLPIYLHENVGFSWDQIGILLSVMLLPYVLFQRFVGKAEDALHQERRVLISGFLILILGTAAIPFIADASIFSWGILLFLTHIGAAFIEVSSESYFFRHVHPNNSGFISFFRLTRTLPYIVVPVLASITLNLVSFESSFIVLACIMFFGIRYAFLIQNKS